MAKRSGSYSVPFSFELLSFDEAVGLAADTGRISGDAGPLLETVVDMLDELGRPDEYLIAFRMPVLMARLRPRVFQLLSFAARGSRLRCIRRRSLCAIPSAWRLMGAS